jgi:LacI family transcriptional regulator
VPKIAHFFFGSVIESIYNTAFENNYETILTVSQENAEREKKHLQTLVSMRVDGIIISISQETQDMEVFHWIKKMGIPLVFLDRQPEPQLPGFNSVLVDDRGGACHAVEHAIRTGYRKLAMIGGNAHINIGKNRLLGFQDALRANAIPIRKEWLVDGGFGTQDGYNGFMQLYHNHELPEFIFAVTYPVALGVYQAAREVGVRIPEDVDIICFGDSDVGRFVSPSLTCVNQPTRELGETAVRMMLETIRHPEHNTEKHIELPTRLIIRETCVGTAASVMDIPEPEHTKEHNLEFAPVRKQSVKSSPAKARKDMKIKVK